MSYDIYLHELAKFAEALSSAGLVAYIGGCLDENRLTIMINYPDFMSDETARRVVEEALRSALDYVRYEIEVLSYEKQVIVTLELH